MLIEVQNKYEVLRMKRPLILSVPLLIFLLGSPASSADFHKGVYAYQTGNYAVALREFRSLAEQGNISAQSNLGLMYENGQGTLKDYARAHMWWSFAASQGNKIAKKFKINVEKKMTPSDLSVAQRLASECVKKNYKKC